MDGIAAIIAYQAHQKKLEKLVKFRRFYSPKQDFSTFDFELEELCCGGRIEERVLFKNRSVAPQIVDIDDF